MLCKYRVNFMSLALLSVPQMNILHINLSVILFNDIDIGSIGRYNYSKKGKIDNTNNRHIFKYIQSKLPCSSVCL